MDLSAAKILVVLVVALMVLGPDRLPQAARQAGRYANELRRFRDGLHAEVTGAFGDAAELSSLPGKGQAFIDSVTAEVLSSTSTGPAGPTGPAAEVVPAGPASGVTPGEGDPNGLTREFN